MGWRQVGGRPPLYPQACDTPGPGLASKEALGTKGPRLTPHPHRPRPDESFRLWGLPYCATQGFRAPHKFPRS